MLIMTSFILNGEGRSEFEEPKIFKPLNLLKHMFLLLFIINIGNTF